MPAKYSFTTHWKINAPLEEVWQAIHDSLEWPAWWKGVVSVKEIEKGDADGIGSIREYTWRSVLPYRLSFHMRLTGLKELQSLRGIAFGELEGEGAWFFESKNNITHITYYWTVITNKPWMNRFSFVLKPAFRYNHNIVMRRGAEGLARKLGAELLSC